MIAAGSRFAKSAQENMRVRAMPSLPLPRDALSPSTGVSQTREPRLINGDGVLEKTRFGLFYQLTNRQTTPISGETKAKALTIRIKALIISLRINGVINQKVMDITVKGITVKGIMGQGIMNQITKADKASAQEDKSSLILSGKALVDKALTPTKALELRWWETSKRVLPMPSSQLQISTSASSSITTATQRSTTSRAQSTRSSSSRAMTSSTTPM